MRPRRLIFVGFALLVAAVAIYWFMIRDSTVVARVHVPILTSKIEAEAELVGVSSTGEIVRFLPLTEERPLPRLSLTEVPKARRLTGHALEQAIVLGAAPPVLRPYLERSFYGEDGVDVMLTSGIELQFGDDSRAALKWKAAAAVLADPSITALDYVDLTAPTRPAYGGEGHALPTLEP